MYALYLFCTEKRILFRHSQIRFASPSSYGGIFETQTREYTLDDFYTLDLSKMDRFHCLRGSGIEEDTWVESDDGSGSESGEDDDEESSESESEGEAEGEEIRVDDADEEGDEAVLTQAEKVSNLR